MSSCVFECKKKGSCINEDNLCAFMVGCRLTKTQADRCRLCMHYDFCVHRKEVLMESFASIGRRYRHANNDRFYL